MQRKSNDVILPKRSVSFAVTQTFDDMEELEADDSEIRLSPVNHSLPADDMEPTQTLLTPIQFASTLTGESGNQLNPELASNIVHAGRFVTDTFVK